MKELIKYVADHTAKLIPGDNAPGSIDVGFHNVLIVKNPDATVFEALVKKALAQDETGLDPLDGRVHTYKEFEQWVGDRDTALAFMALCSHLGLTDLQTPRKQLDHALSADLSIRYSNMGMVFMSKVLHTDHLTRQIEMARQIEQPDNRPSPQPA